MTKQTLPAVLNRRLFFIPDYQRGYAWGEKQWKEFVEDLDALLDPRVRYHYTGTIVTYRRPGGDQIYNLDSLPCYDVVDGQQRLTTCSLYLSILIHELVERLDIGHRQKETEFLFSGSMCRLTLNHDTKDVFHELAKNGRVTKQPASVHQRRLVDAHAYLKNHLHNRLNSSGEAAADYLLRLYSAMTSKLVFTTYEVEEECEIGMTFELMNSRGKDLSVLELLKNYLMHWVSRNSEESGRADLTRQIHGHWQRAYDNLGRTQGRGREDQCLAIAWTLYCSHTPKNWQGYEGFKDDAYLPLRNFKDSAKPETSMFPRTREETQAFLIRFAEGLARISYHYADLVNPHAAGTVTHEELIWLNKIHRAGNIANFLPLMVAARVRREEGHVSERDYCDLLIALECFAYRVFVHEGLRSNAGKTRFHFWADQVFKQKLTVVAVIQSVYALIHYYTDTAVFVKWNVEANDWYKHRHLLRYTLFEYELHLLKVEGKNATPRLQWEELGDSTIEHILPQNPGEKSEWLKRWTDDDRKKHLHDLGNLVLTRNNSNYLNFDFDRKKGIPGESPSYCDSDIRQERKVASYSDWTAKEVLQRRSDISKWINDRWKCPGTPVLPEVEDLPDDDEPLDTNASK
jgi:hypothetical protein